MQINFGYVGQNDLFDANFLIMQDFYFKWRYSRVSERRKKKKLKIRPYRFNYTEAKPQVLPYQILVL